MTTHRTEAWYREHQQRVTGRKVTPAGATAKLGQAATYNRKPDYARILAKQIKAEGLPEPVLEWTFDAQLNGSGRAWRFDLAWPGWLALEIGLLAVEVDGGVHKLANRFAGDIPKHQAAFKLGYKLLRVSPEQVRNGEALELVRKALT